MSEIQTIATVFFALAVLHTFFVQRFAAISHRFPAASFGRASFKVLAEVELVFGIWAGLLILVWSFLSGSDEPITYLHSLNYTEPAFIVAIMCIAGTRPILALAENLISKVSKFLPLPQQLARYCTTMVIGPLSGSFITEPAAMTVTALLLRPYFQDTRPIFRYATLGLLFVNISVGGVLTNFAAPPVLMVKAAWGWDTTFMLANFGGKAILSTILGTALAAFWFRIVFLKMPSDAEHKRQYHTTWWISAVHLAILLLTVINNHHAELFIPIFLFFIGWHSATRSFQNNLNLREASLVGFFLAGLITLGGLQGWWLRPLIENAPDKILFLGAASLTAVVDNAALTYLATLVQDLSDSAKYFIVAGAVCGGGLTIIANAPNPAGYGILNDLFGEDGINPLGLFLGALPYTILTMLCFLIFR